MRLNRLRHFSVAALLVLVHACTDDSVASSDDMTSDTDALTTTSTGGPVADGSGTTGATTAMSGSQTDSSGGASTGGSTSTGMVDPSTTSSTGGSDSGSDSGSSSGTGGIPCVDAVDCDDGQFCNGAEICDMGFCAPGVNPDCADGVGCTTDACDEINDACINTEDNGMCDDGLYCNGPETCDLFADCQAGVVPNCDDGFDCTMDGCDDVLGACTHTPDDGLCQDMSVCNGSEVCTVGAGCGPAPLPLDCNDLIACTIDTCDDMLGGCVHDLDHDFCDNGLYCDGQEQCMLGAGCMDGPPPPTCDDGEPCTDDACNEAAMGACQSLPNDANCPGSQFCTTEGCTAGTPCAVDSDCDDGNACDGIETCDCAMPPCDFVLNPGVCVPNPPAPALNCNDGVSCTNDACVEDDPAVAGMNAAHCENAPSNALCSNGDPCDGIETCDAVLDCQNGAPLVCDDQVGCTDDLCLPGFGCFHPPDPAPCQDASVCNGQEICNPTPAGPLPTLGCEPGPALACPDVDMAPCTIDFCDEAAGGCTTIVDDGMCGCGLHCDPGAPMVDADGCTDECSQALCDGALWQCGNCIDDDGDCDVDDDDSDCFGVCDDNEAGFAGLIPGQNAANNCKMDCYFDDETGAGGGDCVWSHACDPLDPEPHECTCDAPLPPNNLCDANIPGFGGSCDDAYNMQPAGCDALCGDITPNGCDCFGCCTVTLDDGVTQRNVYLGSETNLPACVGMPPPDPCDGNPNEVPSCNADVIDDPVLCKECTQVPSCLNTCENCELCFGETELPPECGGIPECLGEAAQPCGLPGLADCPAGDFCLTGCCVNF